MENSVAVHEVSEFLADECWAIISNYFPWQSMGGNSQF